MGWRQTQGHALVRDIEMKVQYILGLKAKTLPGQTDKITSSQMKLGGLAMSRLLPIAYCKTHCYFTRSNLKKMGPL